MNKKTTNNTINTARVRKAIDWRPELLKSLQDPEEAIAYLNVALEDEDPKMFLVALKNVIEAQDIQIQELSEKSEQ